MELSYPLATATAGEGTLGPWRRAWALITLDRREIWLCVVYSVAIGLLSLVTPIAVQALVNTVSFGSVLQPMIVMTVLVAIALSFAGVTRVLQAYVVEGLQERMLVRGVIDLSQRLLTAEPAALRAVHGPTLSQRFFEIPTLQKSLSSVVVDGIDLLLKLAVGLPLLAFYHPLLLAFALLLLLMIAFVVFVLGRGVLATSIGESSAKYEAANWLEHLARMPAAFRSESALHDAGLRASVAAQRYRDARRAHFQKLVRHLVGGIALKVVGATVLLGVGGALVIESQLTLGQLVAAELVFASIGLAMLKLYKQLEAAYDLVASTYKLGDLLDLPLERVGGEPLAGDGPTSLALTGVTAGHAAPVLTSVDLAVAAGERVAVVGAGASGRSTLLDVMAAELPPLQGLIEIGGSDLRLLDLSSVRQAVALVRDPELVASTIHANVVLPNRAITLAEVEDALHAVELSSVIRNLPSGLKTEVLPSGVPLSRTQARRLALARTLVARPRLVLFDGALDDLGLPDAARDRVLERLLGPTARWTAVVVSTDPAVLARCSRVVTLSDGRLEER